MKTEPMSREAILRRNIADMELALRTQTELKEKAENTLSGLQQKTSVTIGVGNGDGQLFVHGNYESVKAVQSIIFRLEAAEAELAKARGQKPAATVTGKDVYMRGTISICGDVKKGDFLYAAPVPAPAVPAYLLERQENGLSWYIGATTCFGGAWHWTADVNSAIRFSRAKDAAACWNIIARHHVGIGGSGTTETTPKQHIFEDASALLQSAEVTK